MPAHRKTTAQLKRNGAFKKNPKREAARKAEPRTNGPIGPPPDRLTNAQVKCWNEIIAECHTGVLTRADRRIVELAARIEAQLYAGRKITAFHVQQLRGIYASLGMTPTDRSRVAAPAPPPPKSPWDRIDNPSGDHAVQ